MTLLPDPPDSRDYLCKSSPTTARRVDNRRHISSVEQQGPTNSCAAHAGTTICEALEAVNGVAQGDLSRLDLYHYSRILSGLRDKDGGVYLRDICRALTETGVAQETDYPFDLSKVMDTPPADLPRKRCTKYTRIDKTDWVTVKSMLSRGYNILMGAHLYQGFHSIRGPLDSHPSLFATYSNTAKYYGGHAMVIVGYDDEKRYWIIANSWGDWGDHGFCALPYGLLERDTFDLWAIEEFNGLSMPDLATAPEALSLSGDSELVVMRTFTSLNNIPKTLRLKCTGGYLPYKYEVTNLPPWLTILEQSGGTITFNFRWTQNVRLSAKFLITVSDARGQVDQIEVTAVGNQATWNFDAERAAAIKGFLGPQLAEWKRVGLEYKVLPGEVDSAMGWDEGTFYRITT